MIKKQLYSYGGMLRDNSKTKFPNTVYYDAENIRVIAADGETSFSLTTEKGNIPIFEYTNYTQLLGWTVLGDYLVTFCKSTGNTDFIDKVSLVNFNKTSLYSGNLSFPSDGIITCWGSYETDSIQKVYWADGVNQLRVINITEPTITSDNTYFDIVPTYNISSPYVEFVSWGGIHTAGMIQYAYNLIRKHGPQTSLSPLSELLPLKKSKGGGEVNEIVGQINNVKIDNVDRTYDIIRLYAFKYTSYNQEPVISLIAEETIESDIFKYADDGRIIYNMSQEELSFLGGTPIIPKTITGQHNRLLLGGITEQYFDVNIIDGTTLDITDEDYFDTRAYRFPLLSTVTQIKNNLDENYTQIKYHEGSIITVSTEDLIPKTHDCINDYFGGLTQVPVIADGTIITHFDFESMVRHTEIPNGFEGDVLPADLSIAYIGADLILPDKVKAQYTIDGAAPIFALGTVTFDISGQSINFINSKLSEILTNDNPTYKIISKLIYYNNEWYIQAYCYNVENSVVTNYNINESTIVLLNYSTSYVTNYVGNVYKAKSTVFGATGTDLSIEIERKTIAQITDTTKVLKSNEIYRFGIEFWNARGQVSQPNWICDLKIPAGNVDGNYNTLKVTITPEGLGKLKRQGVVGWRVLRVERTEQDRTIITQGIVTPSVFQVMDTVEAIKWGGLQNIGSYEGNEAIRVERTYCKANYIDDGYIKMPSTFIRNYGALSEVWGFDTITQDEDSKRKGGRIYYSDSITESAQIRIEPISNGRPIYGKSYNTCSARNDPRFELFRSQWDDGVSKGYNPARYGAPSQALTYQDTRLINFYSPELTFLNPRVSEQLKLDIAHYVTNVIKDCASWGKQFTQDTQLEKSEARGNGQVSLFNKYTLTDQEFHQNGKIGGGGGPATYELEKDSDSFWDNIFGDNEVVDAGGPFYHEYQYYRKYNYEKLGNDYRWDITGTPTEIGTGEHGIMYDSTAITNLQDKYTFNNSLFLLTADKNLAEPIKLQQQPLISVNSIGHKCYLIIAGEKPLETILEEGYGGTPSQSSLGVFEITRALENQYGGNTYEARSRNSYLRIGRFQMITSNIVSIDRAGDTYVGDYVFERILSNVAAVYNAKYQRYTEIVSFPVETNINLACRHDLSVAGWDAKWQPSFDDFHAYNRVYSQEPIADMTTSLSFLFEPIKTFKTKIITTKVKTPNELIDSWTDILINEELIVDGKYGEIQELVTNNDVAYCFQDKAISWLNIQPRVALQANDGVGVELGTGTVLYNYQYISTDSGTTNRLGIFNSPFAIYYTDIVNRSLNRVINRQVQGLSDSTGFHSYMHNNLLPSYKGAQTVIGFHDKINNEAIFVTPSFTLSYHEPSNSFKTFYGYTPTKAISTDIGIISYSGTLDFYLQNSPIGYLEGVEPEYAKWYGETPQESYITFLMNPEPNQEVVFNGLTFRAELYELVGGVWIEKFTSNGINFTLPISHVRVWNEYQDSGKSEVIYGTDISEKFREWNLWLPRPTNRFSLDRMRGNSVYMTLYFDNTNNYKMVLHDIILNYTAKQ